MAKDMVTYEPRPYELSEKQVSIIANTEFVPQAKRGKHDVIWASIFRGRSLGIDDMTAINEIHVVNGKPGESAALAAGLVRRRGHKIDIERGPNSVTVHGTRADNGATDTVTWTMEMAQNAGLAGKQVWKQYPQSMLRARAITELCRSLFSDCFLGGTYTPEELGADFAVYDDVIDADMIEDLPAGSASERDSGDSPSGGDAGGPAAPRSLAEFKQWVPTTKLTNGDIASKSTQLFGHADVDRIEPEQWTLLWLHLIVQHGIENDIALASWLELHSDHGPEDATPDEIEAWAASFAQEVLPVG